MLATVRPTLAPPEPPTTSLVVEYEISVDAGAGSEVAAQISAIDQGSFTETVTQNMQEADTTLASVVLSEIVVEETVVSEPTLPPETTLPPLPTDACIDRIGGGHGGDTRGSYDYLNFTSSQCQYYASQRRRGISVSSISSVGGYGNSYYSYYGNGGYGSNGGY